MEAFSSLMPMLMKGLGPLSSLFGMINQMSLASKEKSAMDQSIYYSKHPEAINALAKKFQQPLSSGLTAGIGNEVNASMAEQGLSQAPGIQSQVLAQALAPAQLKEQQMALESAFQAIGLPASALKAIQSTMRPDDLSAMLKNILPQSPTPTGGGGGGSSQFPWGLTDTPTGTMSDTGITPPTFDPNQQGVNA